MSKGWEDQAAFMREHNATHATWTIDGHGDAHLTSLTLAPMAPAAPPPKGPAQQMAALLEQRRREHQIRFAASRVKPRFEETKPVADDVPRAVRAREASRGRPSNKKRS